MKRILICPLDWGLGHATRCVPIIRELLIKEAEIFIASSGSALTLLQQEFPQFSFFELPSYRPSYSSGWMSLSMIRQLPKFRKVIAEEHILIERLVDEHKIDVVISDNRYGCWSAKAKSIIITHQINLLMPKGMGWASGIVNYFIHRYIGKFNEIWIPDLPGGAFTAPFTSEKFPNRKYIGWLSRFKQGRPVQEKYEIIALISGPEPQRSIFEKLLTNQLTSLGLKSLLVTGEPGKSYSRRDGCLEIVNHLTATELEDSINASGIVVSRSGYSTIMDLIAIGKNAIFVPTLQQPEQLFFAKYLMEKKVVFSMEQEKFSLKEALEKTSEYKGLAQYKFDTSFLLDAIGTVV